MVTSEEIREALQEPVRGIVDTVKATLEATPPELAADLVDSGVVMAGGGSLLRGLDRVIAEEINLPVRVAARSAARARATAVLGGRRQVARDCDGQRPSPPAPVAPPRPPTGRTAPSPPRPLTPPSEGVQYRPLWAMG